MRPNPRELVLALVSWIDRLVPKGRGIVLRTVPDYGDEGRELVAALADAGVQDITWLMTDPRPELDADLPCQVLRAETLPGLVRYWRARVVVHTHGVFGSRSGARGKRFVNLWHGMPIKRIEKNPDVARLQTDCSIATAEVHRHHLAETWGIPESRILITGLPRNDVIVAQRDQPPPPQLRALTGGKPLVVWLPTFRSTALWTEHKDGIDLGTVTNFEGADLEAVNATLARAGAHGLIKPHPLAPKPEVASLSNLDVLSTDELHAAGLTLYEVLAHTDCLITDHSSVWIDFLLADRPILFALSDREAHEQGRGFYFDDLEALFPGPLATSWRELEPLLTSTLGGEDPWRARREAARAMHHAHVDARSAARVAAAVIAIRDGWKPEEGTRPFVEEAALDSR